jgi:hypothetical protein
MWYVHHNTTALQIVAEARACGYDRPDGLRLAYAGKVAAALEFFASTSAFEALRAWQASHIDARGEYLQADGVLGPLTRDALCNPRRRQNLVPSEWKTAGIDTAPLEWRLAVLPPLAVSSITATPPPLVKPNTEQLSKLSAQWDAEPFEVDERGRLAMPLPWDCRRAVIDCALAEYLQDVREVDGANRGARVDVYSRIQGRSELDAGGPWCANFVCWLLKYAFEDPKNRAVRELYGLPLEGEPGWTPAEIAELYQAEPALDEFRARRMASVRRWRNFGREAGIYRPNDGTYIPRPGDLQLQDFGEGRGHISLIVGVPPACYLLEGVTNGRLAFEVNTIGGNEGNALRYGRRNLRDSEGFVTPYPQAERETETADILRAIEAGAYSFELVRAAPAPSDLAQTR